MITVPKSGGLLALIAFASLTTGCEEKAVPEDGDRDGYSLEEGDCNDGNADVHPGAVELCNNSDDDCDSNVDEDAGDAIEFFIDYDEDGFGSDGYTEYACDAPAGYVDNDLDCRDDDPEIHPDAEELCNGSDEDCDEVIDEGANDPVTWYIDYDGDGYGTDDYTVDSCEIQKGYTENPDDCDDGDETVFPGADEYCDDVDNDCDALVDEDAVDPTTWYADDDFDGYGDPADEGVEACTAPPATADNNDDCDDTNEDFYPGADEYCNGYDEDCDSVIDEDTVGLGSWWTDSDDDGYGDPASDEVLSCEEVEGSVINDDDCDDGDGDVYPGAEESCNDGDDDCDAAVDEDATDALIWYYDEDGDGFGLAESSLESCSEPADYADASGDCDDTDDQIHPDRPEICDGVDQDCDADIDEGTGGTAVTYYADFDEDGYGDAAADLVTCDERPTGFVDDDSDCDDSDAMVHPGALEICDGVKNDCDDGVWSADDQIVSFLDALGRWSDLSEDISVGTSTAPASIEIDDDGVVMFCDGTYYANLVSDGSAVSVASLGGAGSTVISGGSADSVIVANDSLLEISGVTITDGAASSGGGLYLSTTTAVLTDVIISGNYAVTYGGGAYIQASDLTLIDSVITGNAAGAYGGGMLIETSTVRMESSSLDENSASYGGAIYAQGGELFLDECAVTGNTDYFATGGSLYLWVSTADVSDTDFVDNTPYDTYIEDVGESYSWSVGATFDCDVTGCE